MYAHNRLFGSIEAGLDSTPNEDGRPAAIEASYLAGDLSDPANTGRNFATCVIAEQDSEARGLNASACGLRQKSTCSIVVQGGNGREIARIPPKWRL